jgi:hypothetical protein
MKGTFYDVFVGGATVPECAAQIDGYRAKGVSFSPSQPLQCVDEWTIGRMPPQL